MLFLQHGEFLGSEINRICVPGFIVTFRRSGSGQRDEKSHSHSTANLLVPFDRGYWSEADGFDEANPLQIIYTPARTAHHDSMVRLGGRYLAISVDNGLLEDHDQDLRVPVALARPLARRLAHRIALSDAAGHLRGLRVEEACLTLLAELDLHRRMTVARPPRWLNRVVDICNSTFERSPSISEIGAMVGVHPVHVTRVFRRRYGIPLSKYVAAVKIEHAAAGLRAGRMSVAAIAVENGFCDQSHLCKVFKATLGVTPRTYQAHFPQ